MGFEQLCKTEGGLFCMKKCNFWGCVYIYIYVTPACGIVLYSIVTGVCMMVEVCRTPGRTA